MAGNLETNLQDGPRADRCNWSYNPHKWPHKWRTEVISPTYRGDFTPFIAGRGPSCESRRAFPIFFLSISRKRASDSFLSPTFVSVLPFPWLVLHQKNLPPDLMYLPVKGFRKYIYIIFYWNQEGLALYIRIVCVWWILYLQMSQVCVANFGEVSIPPYQWMSGGPWVWDILRWCFPIFCWGWL